MESTGSNQQLEEKQKRPVLLTVLCILTFTGSGVNIFSSFMIAGFFDLFVEIMREFSDKFNIPGMEMLADATPAFFLVSGLFYIGSVAGALFMFLQKKTGFHIYTISQILLLIAPMFFLHLPGPGIVELLFSGLFILLYAMNLKFMS